MKQLCDVYGIEQRRTSPYHPQADGMVERFNKFIMNLIHHASEKKNDWDEVSVLITSAYNSTVHDSTGFTPNYLTFGAEIVESAAKLVPDPER